MPNEIRHKTSTTASAVPTAAQLTAGELAVNAASGKVYTKKADGTVVDLTDVQIMDGGEQFTPLAVSDLALWLDGADPTTQYQTQAGGATAVTAPTDIAGCFAWWDASDASTLTVAPVTNRISQWTDKVSGRNFTANTTAAQPLRETGTLNGRNVVRFETATNMAVANDKTSWNFLHQPTGGGWLFMVLQPFNTFSTDQWGRVIGTSNFSSANVGFDFFIDDRHSNGQQSGAARCGVQRGVSGTSVSAALVVNSFSNDTDAYIVAIKYDSGNATAAERLRLFINGIGGANITSATDTASTANASADLTLGIGSAITGYVAEILIYNTSLSDINRARIEKYLAVKWGIKSVTNTIAQDTAPITTPLEITNNPCALWLDGSDANTMYDATTSGNLVTTNSAVLRWEDKSGNGKHATQSNSSLAPTRFLNGLNNRAVLNFNATRAMTAGAIGDWNFLHNAEGGAVFMVLKPAVTADPQDFAFLLATQQNTSSQVGIGLFFDDRAAGFNRNNYLSCFVFYGVSGQTVINTEQNNFFTTANAYAIVSTILNAGCSTPVANRAALYRDGTRLGSNNTQTNAPSAANSSVTLQIGNPTANSFAEVAEIIIFRRPLSDVDRARVEAYLAAKWGLSVPNSQPPVGSWQDRSGNNRHATQTIAANRPTTGVLNSRQTISFAGANSVTTPDYPAKAISTYFYVSRHTDSAETIFQTGPTNSFHSHIIETTHKFRRIEVTNQGVVLGTNLGVGALAVWCVDYSNNLISVRYNGATIAQVGSISAGGNITDSSRATTIGRLTPTETYLPLNGNVAEFMVYGGRHLSTTEKRTVERYLAAKWGITLAPQVSNLDAQDWINRVYLAGGTVTQGTAAAVNNFCAAINAAGIRDRFYRLNLFCGDNLTACLVPLYRGPSLSGTQFGNVTDTNVSFLSTDYVETGSSGGLVGNGSSKYLQTGTASNAWMGLNQGSHITVYKMTPTNSGALVGGAVRAADATQSQIWEFGAGGNAVGGPTGSFAAPGGHNSFLGVTREPGTGTAPLRAFRNDQFGSDNSGGITPAGISVPITVFARNSLSTDTNTYAPSLYSNQRLAAYSVGLHLTNSNVVLLNTAMQAFQAALSRAIT